MNTMAMRTIFIVSIALLFSLNAKAEKVTCPPGLSWTFEGQCMRPLDSKGSSCPPGTTLAKLHATGPLVCKGRWKCLSDINKVPNANGICVDPEEVKPIPRQYTQKMIHTTPKPEPPKSE
jgi:hypothetical protein